MSVSATHRPIRSYAEARAMAARERAIALSDLWEALRNRVAGAIERPRLSDYVEAPAIGMKPDPSKDMTSSPCWFTPVLSEKTMPQPGREASGRLLVHSEK